MDRWKSERNIERIDKSTMNGMNGPKNGLQIKYTGREKKKHQRDQRDTQLTNLKLKTSEKNQPTRFEMKKSTTGRRQAEGRLSKLLIIEPTV